MNPYLLAILLGIVEGLTEFLPVSSTAHIRLVQAGLAGEASLSDNFWKLFAVVIQLPAILAVLVYFRKRIVAFLRSFFAPGLTMRDRLSHPVTLVLVATVVTAIPAALAKKLIKDNLESLWIMGGALVVGGVIMWVVDAIFGKRDSRNEAPVKSLEEMSLWQAAWIGAVQVLSAVFPGTSRSMSTIAAGQIAGLSRPTALEFSFFVSIPIMFAACLKDLKDSLDPADSAYVGHSLTSSEWMQIAIGGAVSFVVALAVIAWFMAWVRKRGFVPFAVYRIIIGAAVLMWAYRAHP